MSMKLGIPRARCGMPTRYGSYMTQPQTVVLGRNVSPGRVRKKCTDASQIGGLFYVSNSAPMHPGPLLGAVGSSQSVPIALAQLHQDVEDVDEDVDLSPILGFYVPSQPQILHRNMKYPHVSYRINQLGDVGGAYFAYCIAI